MLKKFNQQFIKVFISFFECVNLIEGVSDDEYLFNCRVKCLLPTDVLVALLQCGLRQEQNGRLNKTLDIINFRLRPVSLVTRRNVLFRELPSNHQAVCSVLCSTVV